jgi:hypothetical protein
VPIACYDAHVTCASPLVCAVPAVTAHESHPPFLQVPYPAIVGAAMSENKLEINRRV